MTIREATRSSTRLLIGADSVRRTGRTDASLGEHLSRFGELPQAAKLSASSSDWLIREIEMAGLRGRGGGGFPSSTKERVAMASGKPVLVVNAMEGEPASKKDRILIAMSPHLVIDGAELLASLVGSKRVVICVPAEDLNTSKGLLRALRERSAMRLPIVPLEVCSLPGRYVTGEESALVAAASGAIGVPSFRPDKSKPLRIGSEVALVHNVETLANAALIARYGAAWFKELGALEAPGTCLVTVSGDVERPGVVEVATGTPIDQILALATPTADITAVLVGGYGGSWLPEALISTPFAPDALAPFGATMGAGVLVVLGAWSCGLRATARIARLMAGESAGQCGPCLFGLAAPVRVGALFPLGPANVGAMQQEQSWGALVVG